MTNYTRVFSVQQKHNIINKETSELRKQWGGLEIDIAQLKALFFHYTIAHKQIFRHSVIFSQMRTEI